MPLINLNSFRYIFVFIILKLFMDVNLSTHFIGIFVFPCAFFTLNYRYIMKSFTKKKLNGIKLYFE